MKKLIVLVMISICVPAAIQARTTRPAFQKAVLEKRQIKRADTLTSGKKPYIKQDIKTKRLTLQDGKSKTTVTTTKATNPQELKEIAQRHSKFPFGKGNQQFKDWQKKKLKPIRPVN